MTDQQDLEQEGQNQEIKEEEKVNEDLKEKEPIIEGELIYNEEKGTQDMEKLFNDDEEGGEYDTYEIEFKILDQNKQPKLVVIELQKIKYKKPYFGGYVNKTNGTYYYHAYAQTDQYKNEYCLKEHRDAQTYEYRTCSTKMTREFGTQMAYVGLYIDTRQDKEIHPTEYFTSEKWEEKKINTVRHLQKMMRGFFARKTCRELKKAREEEKKLIEIQEEEEHRKNEAKNRKEIKRRLHPKTNTDFKLLKKELDTWVQTETIRIKSSNLSDEDKRDFPPSKY